MTYIKGFNRNQAVLIPEAIDLLIDKNNEIRFIDSFIDSLNIVAFGFKNILEYPETTDTHCLYPYILLLNS
jgi:transposase